MEDDHPTVHDLLGGWLNPDFAYGFEAGRVWSLLTASDEALVVAVHAPRPELLLRMAEATERELHTVELGNDWLEAHYGTPDHGLYKTWDDD